MTKRIHITSSGPRTGTTLLTEVIKNCFEIDCSCEHEASIALSNSSFGKCENVLTKLPSSTDKLRTILDYTKNVFVICIIRDPRDMVVSFHGRYPDTYYCELNYWFKFISDYKKLKDHPRFLMIRYEDFTQKPDEIQKTIKNKFKFLKQKYLFSEYHIHAKPDEDTLKALKKLRPIESKGIGNWKNHSARVKQQINKYDNISESLIKFGYEENDKWEDALKDIKLQEFSSIRDENTTRFKSNKAVLITLFNFYCEKIGLNPDKLLAPLRKIAHSNKTKQIEKK